MKLNVLKGKESVLVNVFIQDSSSTTGAGLASLTNATSGLVAYYSRADQGDNAATAISLGAGTRGTWSSGGFKEKDATNLPGVYELGIPNAALVTGSDFCLIMLKGAANMAPCVLEIQLTANDPDVALAVDGSGYVTANLSGDLTATMKTSVTTAAQAAVPTVNSVNLPVSITGDLTATMKTSVATAVLTTAMTEAYAADGATCTVAQALYMIKQMLMEKSVSSTTMTVNKLDGTTSAMTFTLGDATNPTSITRAS